MGHVIFDICNITSFPEVEAYLHLRDLSSPEGFAIAEQVDFHDMIPDFGKVAVRKLLILSNYVKVHERFPPPNSSIYQLKRALIKSHDWEDQIRMPSTPVKSPGGSPTTSEKTLTPPVQGELLIAKEAGVSIVKVKEFSGKPQDWGTWYMEA